MSSPSPKEEFASDEAIMAIPAKINTLQNPKWAIQTFDKFAILILFGINLRNCLTSLLS